MPENNSSQNAAEDLLKVLSKHLGLEADTIKNAALNGNISEVLKNLDPKDAEKIQNVISDKNATSKLLNSSQAKFLLEKLLGEKGEN
ncbi:hypothetical protein FACS189465_2630 [Clostridia bacterium]|nr:hypothetical protein FACS189465_2630 [Clostridia bacterium]